MAIVKDKAEIKNEGIIPLRFYKHYKGGVYFVNGFAVHEKTLKTVVIYTDGYSGTAFVRFAEEFAEKVESGEKRFELMEKKV